MIKTLSVRIKDKHAKVLNQMAFEANQVWNAVNAWTSELSYVPIPEAGYVPVFWSAFDLQKQLKTIRAERGLTRIDSTCVQEVIAEHAKARKQFKTSKLRWRASSGSKRSLGWIPFKKGAAKLVNGQVRYNKHYFKIWDSYGLKDFAFRAGNFSQDARGRWYFNVAVEFDVKPKPIPDGVKSLGVDLGLKDVANCSDGFKLEAKRFYRDLEPKLGIAQRANKKDTVRSIHAKIKNRRKDFLHKLSTKLVKENGAIFVGDVSSQKLVKTKMAKSVLDAGWGMLKTQLQYKAIAQGVWFEVVDERYTTQVCSCCGSISANSPKGRTGLGIREWLCVECGTLHDRDINSAKNILALGHKRLAGGIPCL